MEQSKISVSAGATRLHCSNAVIPNNTRILLKIGTRFVFLWSLLRLGFDV